MQVLIAGTVIYNGILRLPWSVYEDGAPKAAPDAAIEDSESPSAALLLAVDSTGAINGPGPAAGRQPQGLDVGINFSALTETPEMRKQIAIKTR